MDIRTGTYRCTDPFGIQIKMVQEAQYRGMGVAKHLIKLMAVSFFPLSEEHQSSPTYSPESTHTHDLRHFAMHQSQSRMIAGKIGEP